MTAVQTLDVVYGLVNNMKVVMKGAHPPLIWMPVWYNGYLVGGKASTDNIQETLGASSRPLRKSSSFFNVVH